MPVPIVNNTITDEQCAQIVQIGQAQPVPPPQGTTEMVAPWGVDRVTAEWPSANTLVISMSIPQNAIWGDLLISYGEFNGPPTYRRAALAAGKGDFDSVIAASGGNSGNLGPIELGQGGPLKPGTEYYLNFRNEFENDEGQWVPSCQQPQCPMVVSFQYPK